MVDFAVDATGSPFPRRAQMTVGARQARLVVDYDGAAAPTELFAHLRAWGWSGLEPDPLPSSAVEWLPVGQRTERAHRIRPYAARVAGTLAVHDVEVIERTRRHLRDLGMLDEAATAAPALSVIEVLADRIDEGALADLRSVAEVRVVEGAEWTRTERFRSARTDVTRRGVRVVLAVPDTLHGDLLAVLSGLAVHSMRTLPAGASGQG